jgi:hypothetical protein
VDVHQSDHHLSVEIGDDGAGGADVRPGFGLQGLRDRIAAVNGTLDGGGDVAAPGLGDLEPLQELSALDAEQVGDRAGLARS